MEPDLKTLVANRDVDNNTVQDYSLPIMIVGSDVEALYPSLDAERVAMIVYIAIMQSEIKWDNIDYLEAARYVAMNQSAELASLEECCLSEEGREEHAQG